MSGPNLGKGRLDVVTLFVEELEETVSFYRKVFGLSPVYEDDHSAVFDFANISVNLLRTTEAPGLMDPAVVAHAADGSRFLFTIRVEDVDAVCRELSGLGVALLNGPVDRPWGVRTASFADPAGHAWEIAQPIRE